MVLKYLEGLSIKSDNKAEILKNVYIDRQKKYEFFGKRSEFINNEIIKITQSSSTIQANTSDEANNHFSITFSSGYGSGVLCKNTGMYFNNSLGEVELNPQGFLGDTRGDRLISNMSPLIIETNEGISTIGSPGADRISSAIAQVLINYTKSKKYFNSSVKYSFLANAMEKGYYFYSLIHLGEIAVLEKEFNLALKYFKKVRKVTGRKHEANQLAKEKIKQIQNE